MNIHEHQAKALLAKYGVAIPRGAIASRADEAESVAADIGGSSWVVKAQIHAGDRGKAGGVKVVESLAKVREAASRMLGMTLVTPQTGLAGQKVNVVYVEQGYATARELYLGMLVDRRTARVSFMASSEGGGGIEEIAEKSPDKVSKVTIDPGEGLKAEQTSELNRVLGLDGAQAETAVRFMEGIYEAFTGLDASLIEINPLCVTEAGELLALDVKMSFDDNALYRHQELQDLQESGEDDPQRLEREQHGFNYIRLNGNIGCLVTGAGLSLATLDLIKLKGGEPANFLDLPPVATRLQVAAAFKLVLSDPRVKAILVNAVGGGVTRCDVIAEGVWTAARETEVQVPVVVRFAGTSTEMCLMLLQNSKLTFTAADDMSDAVDKVIAAAKGV